MALERVIQSAFLGWVRMKILICNDDGYQAPGIEALCQAMRTLGEVEVVAPEHNNSAKSNALTLYAPLYVREAPATQQGIHPTSHQATPDFRGTKCTASNCCCIKP